MSRHKRPDEPAEPTASGAGQTLSDLARHIGQAHPGLNRFERRAEARRLWRAGRRKLRVDRGGAGRGRQ